MTGVADTKHYGCDTANVRDLRKVKIEEPLVRRRGRPRSRYAPAKIWLGYCAACNQVRLFLAKPPEQRELFAEAPRPRVVASR